MKSISIAVAALLLQGATPGPGPNPASIEGIVVKVGAADVQLLLPTPGASSASNAKGVRGTGEPLADATVELTAIVGDRVRSTIVKTGPDGKFVFKNVPPGDGYHLVAIHSPEYLPSQYGQRFPGQPGTPISLASGQQLKDARIVMARAGSISGRVVDSNPRPGPGVNRSITVTAVRPIYDGGRRVLGQLAYGKTGIAATAVAASDGAFRFSGLLPGQYYICTNPIGKICYTEKNQGEPAPINLRVGDNVTGLSVDNRTLGQRVLRGEVVSSVKGETISGAQVGLVPIDAGPNNPANPLRGSRGPSSAIFQMSANPGSYFLVAATEKNGIFMFGYLPVRVRGSDVSGLRVVVTPVFDISTQISGNISPTAVIRLQPQIPGMPSAPAVGFSGNGSLTLQDVTAGEYRVEVLTPGAQNAYLKSLRFGGRDLTDGILRVEAASKSKLEIVLGSNAATVGGNVFRESVSATLPDELQTAVEGMRVVLVPDGARRDRQDLYKDAFSDAFGEFKFQGVAPGDYKLFAWELVQDGAWHDPEFIRLYDDFGKKIHLVEGNKVLLDINLIPGLN